MLKIRETVRLSRGAVVLQGWPAATADTHLLELATLTATLFQVRQDWASLTREDIDPQVWAAFWRLVNASLVPGQTLPQGLSWADRHRLLDAMWELNELEELEAPKGKVTALHRRLTRTLTRLQRMQGQTTHGLSGSLEPTSIMR